MPYANETATVDPIEQVRAARHPFGRQLRELRLAHQLTQIEVWLLSEEIAQREGSVDFVVGNSQLSLIENDHALPGPAKLLALGEIYGLTREQLMKLWATISCKRLFVFVRISSSYLVAQRIRGHCPVSRNQERWRNAQACLHNLWREYRGSH